MFTYFLLYTCVYIGLEDHKCTLILQEIEEAYCEIPQMVSSQFSDFADSIRDAYSMPTPTSFEEGLELYFVLIHILQQCNLDNLYSLDYYQ